MLLKSNNFTEASVLVQILPNTDKFKMIKALTMCLCGRYKGGSTPKEEAENMQYFNTIANSSPRNKVVMYLAMQTAAFDGFAEQAVKELPQDDVLTDYFWAIINCRKATRLSTANDTFGAFMAEDEAINRLKAAIAKDRNYYYIAKTDKDISESVFKIIDEDMAKAKAEEQSLASR